MRQRGIEHLYLFGSTLRGDAREDSDVDLFFDHPVGSIGLYELIDLKQTASRILGRPADIKDRHPEFPWPKVASIGNILRHEYQDVAPDVLWHVVQHNLPPLLTVCRAEPAREHSKPT